MSGGRSSTGEQRGHVLGRHELDRMGVGKGRKSAGLRFALERAPFAVGMEGAQA